MKNSIYSTCVMTMLSLSLFEVCSMDHRHTPPRDTVDLVRDILSSNPSENEVTQNADKVTGLSVLAEKLERIVDYAKSINHRAREAGLRLETCDMTALAALVFYVALNPSWTRSADAVQNVTALINDPATRRLFLRTTVTKPLSNLTVRDILLDTPELNPAPEMPRGNGNSDSACSERPGPDHPYKTHIADAPYTDPAPVIQDVKELIQRVLEKASPRRTSELDGPMPTYTQRRAGGRALYPLAPPDSLATRKLTEEAKGAHDEAIEAIADAVHCRRNWWALTQHLNQLRRAAEPELKAIARSIADITMAHGSPDNPDPYRKPEGYHIQVTFRDGNIKRLSPDVARYWNTDTWNDGIISDDHLRATRGLLPEAIRQVIGLTAGDASHADEVDDHAFQVAIKAVNSLPPDAKIDHTLAQAVKLRVRQLDATRGPQLRPMPGTQMAPADLSEETD